jgi:hypothetical protein
MPFLLDRVRGVLRLAGSVSKSLTGPQEFANKLELIVENLEEDDFVSAVKGYRPDITKEELQEWVMRFRAAVREKRGLY